MLELKTKCSDTSKPPKYETIGEGLSIPKKFSVAKSNADEKRTTYCKPKTIEKA